MWVEEEVHKRRGLEEGKGEKEREVEGEGKKILPMAITKGARESVRPRYPDHTLSETRTTPPPPQYTHTGLSVCVCLSVYMSTYSTLWLCDTMQVASTDSTAVTTVCLWALSIIQRTHAKQCHCTVHKPVF